MCSACRQRPVAINYWRDQKPHYRSRCDVCIKRKRQPRAAVPRWRQSGYEKKMRCDCCGFRARYAAQIIVYHVDGDLNHNDAKNLKSVCQNCAVAINRGDSFWRPGDLEPDS
jgi:hypothetical protein